MHLLLNATHTHTGGGLTYLRHILPALAANPTLRLTLLAPKATLEKLDIPANVTLWEAPAHGFLKTHLWEQCVLPFQARARGIHATLCNANFTPLLAPRPMPILHTTASAATVTRGQVSRAYWWVLRLLTTLAILRAPVVFSLTPMMAHEFTPFPLRFLRRKVVLTPPGIPEGSPPKVKRNPNLLLAVGDFYAQKDYPTLLRTFALLKSQAPKAQLHIIGKPVFPAVEAEMHRLIMELNLETSVTLTANMPRETLLKRMAEATAVVSTSTVESFNIPLIEAMAMGTPVTVLDAPYVQHVVGDAALVVKRGGDTPSALAVALYALLENDAIRQTFIQRGHTHSQQYRWQTTTQAILKALKNLAPST